MDSVHIQKYYQISVVTGSLKPTKGARITLNPINIINRIPGLLFHKLSVEFFLFFSQRPPLSKESIFLILPQHNLNLT